jgi:hypothetical protein
MQVLLSCTECDYKEHGHTEKELMNKIIIWNHIKKEHPSTAERVMRLYQHVPSSLFHVTTDKEVIIERNLQPRFA